MAIWIGSSFKEDDIEDLKAMKIRRIKSNSKITKVLKDKVLKPTKLTDKQQLIKEINNMLDNGYMKYTELDLFKRILKELTKNG